ncbi:MAG: hypothetical protein MUE73_18285 [Planctomycetes bacterium]|jgi:hypothetical protein|nr:hypothetical protein [Planctomycetota bacterium]
MSRETPALAAGMKASVVAVLVVAVLLAMAALPGGCVIPALSREIDEAGHEAREFGEAMPAGGLTECEGAFTGEEERDGSRWLRFEFPGLLAGEGGRILAVLVSEGESDGVRRLLVTDTAGPAAARAPARLLVYRTPGCDFGGFRPADHPGEHLLCLRVVADDEECAADGAWMPPEPHRAPEGWRRAAGEVDFRWEVRCRAAVAGLTALYPFAVLADAVIVPAVALLICLCPQSCF